MQRIHAKYLTAFSLITILPFSLGCDISLLFDPGIPGSGVSETEDRDVEEFKEIEFAGSGKLNIQCGQEPALSVTTDDNLLEYIETEVDGDALEIHPTERIAPEIRPVFDIKTCELTSIELAGSGDIEVLDFDGDELDLEVAGSGKFKIVGVCESLELAIAGSGNADLSDLVCKNVKIEIAGSGSAYVHAIESLKVDVAGSGNVKYIGDPKVSKSIFGSGSVRQVSSTAEAEADSTDTIEVSTSDKAEEETAAEDEEDE